MKNFAKSLSIKTIFLILFYPAIWLILVNNLAAQECNSSWKIHDRTRPKPKVIAPPISGTQEKSGKAPSDAIVLFDGTDLNSWRSTDGSPAKWKIQGDYMEAVEGSGYIRTSQNFGNCQLHIEWATPVKITGESQGRGNSGVFLMGKYEIQVLDSYQNETYADGQAAAIYGQFPPSVNACRAPGEWQTYDIIFRTPKFCSNKEIVQPARVTVFHNGVLVHENVEILGPTNWMQRSPYKYHRARLPLALQDHGNPVRYRNIWIRELPEAGEILPAPTEITISDKTLEKYAGEYRVSEWLVIPVIKDENGLSINMFENQPYEIFAQSENFFFAKKVDITIQFQTNKESQVEGLIFNLSGSDMKAKKIK